jgi:hypothetical protein
VVVGRHRAKYYGREDFTGNPADRYKFRTPSLRNVAVEAAYVHDGAYTTLAAAIRRHLNARASLLAYDPKTQGLPTNLAGPIGLTAPHSPPSTRCWRNRSSSPHPSSTTSSPSCATHSSTRAQLLRTYESSSRANCPAVSRR